MKIEERLKRANMNLNDTKLDMMNWAMGIKKEGTFWQKWQIHILIAFIFIMSMLYLWYNKYMFSFWLTSFIFGLLFYKTIKGVLSTK